MRKVLPAIFLFCFATLFAQQKQRNAPVTIRGVIGIPRNVSSQKFRTAFAGLCETNLSVNARLFSNFFAGIGYQNTFFKNSGMFKYAYFNASIPYNTRLVGSSGFIKLGYDQFFEKTYVSYSLNTGFMLAKYKNINEDTTAANKPLVGTGFTAPYVQPEIALNFLADRSLNFSLILSYTTLFYKFDAKAPRFNGFGDIINKKNNYVMSWINIGFGVTILINSKK